MKPHNRPCQFAKKFRLFVKHVFGRFNIFRLCSFMCDILLQDKVLNKLVLNGQIRTG